MSKPKNKEVREGLLTNQVSVAINSSGGSRIWDYCFIFPEPTTLQKPATVTVSKAKKMVEDVFKNNKFEQDTLPNVSTMYNRLTTNNTPISSTEFAELLRKMIVEVLSVKCGLTTYMFRSRDKDEIFCKIAADEEDLMTEADRTNYKLKLVDSMDTLGTAPGPCLAFDRKYLDKYERYDSAVGKSLFRGIDRIRLVDGIINQYIDIGHLENHGLLVSHYPLHNKQELAELQQSWGRIGAMFKSQPLDKIRSYFGEKIGLYFCWLGFYATWLLFPGILGLVLFILQRGTKGLAGEDELNFGFCIVMALWATLFYEFWKRRNATVALEWGVRGFEEDQPPRPQFDGELRKNPITGETEKWYPAQRRTIKMICSLTVALSMIACVIIAVVGIFSYRNHMVRHRDQYGEHGPKFAAALNAVQIKIMNVIYGKLAVWFTNWENHRTQTQYEDSLIAKTFLFQFVNSYNSLFYIAFLKEGTDPMGCKDGDCMFELYTQLATIFLINLAMNVVEIGKPIIVHHLKIKAEDKAVRKLQAADPNVRLDMTDVEQQSKLFAYDDTFDDYLEMTVQFGYVVLFCAAFPLTPILAYINNAFEIRLDAYKLCKINKRPFPNAAEDIGTWGDILELMSMVAVLTNCGVAAFTSHTFHDSTLLTKVFVFLVAEHALIAIKLLIAYWVPDVPEDVAVKGARQDHLVLELTLGPAPPPKQVRNSVAENVDHTVHDDDK